MKDGGNGFLVILALLTVSQAFAFRVVLDPGHGGTDMGTVHDEGRLHLTEKDVTLLLAREAAAALKKKGIQVTLTRGNDREVPLPARTQVANRLKADLFLSIHMNSTQNPGRDPEGVETYILNNSNNASSQRLARLENSVVGSARDKVDADDVSAPMDVALILKDLTLDANLVESKRLACAVQEQVVRATSKFTRQRPGIRLTSAAPPRVRDRGVKQALFHVLLGADMPSALLEAGFLTSARDRAVVLSPQGRRAIGRAIAAAIARFRDESGTPRARRALSRCLVH